jgi:aminotransferase
LPKEAEIGDKHSYFTYCIRTPRRDELAHFLLKKGIYTTLRYHPLHLNPLYGQLNVKLKNSEILNSDALSIPIHPRVTDTELDHIIYSITSFLS